MSIYPLPCPVCDSTNICTFEQQEGLFVASCENDDCAFGVQTHGASIKEAIAIWNTRPAPRSAVQTTDAIRWQRVNDEPFEYAIQQGPHGDEFVKLLNGTCLRRTFAVAQAASKQLSDFAELKLLIDEYDPTNSDWNFRRGVLLDILVRLWPQASPVPSAPRGGEA